MHTEQTDVDNCTAVVAAEGWPLEECTLPAGHGGDHDWVRCDLDG